MSNAAQLRDLGLLGASALSAAKQQYLSDVLRGAVGAAMAASSLDPATFVVFLLSPAGTELRGNLVAQILGAAETHVTVQQVTVEDRRP